MPAEVPAARCDTPSVVSVGVQVPKPLPPSPAADGARRLSRRDRRRPHFASQGEASGNLTRQETRSHELTFLSSRLPWFRHHSRALKKATGEWTPRGAKSTTRRDASRGLTLSADRDPRTPSDDRRPPESAPVSRKEEQLSATPKRKDESRRSEKL